MRCIHSTAFGLTPPTALLSTMPPNTSMPGTTFITSAARLAVSLIWFFSTMPRMPRDFARLATSMSSMLRPNTSGCECTCMSITPAAGLTFGGGGGNAACARASLAANRANPKTSIKLASVIFLMVSSLGPATARLVTVGCWLPAATDNQDSALTGEVNHDEDTSIHCTASCSWNGISYVRAGARSAEIQPDRGSHHTDRKQHAWNSRAQALCRQPFAGRHHLSHHCCTERAVAVGRDDAEQQSGGQRAVDDLDPVDPGAQRHPYRCPAPHDGEGLCDRPAALGPRRQRRRADQSSE